MKAGAVYLAYTTGSMVDAGWFLFAAWLIAPSDITIRG